MLSAVYPFFKGWLANGTSPAAGCKLYTYATGGTIPKTTYSDAGLTTPNANPIILDANGEARIFLGSGNYRFDLKTPGDALINTFDPIGNTIGGTIITPGAAAQWYKLTAITHTQFQTAALVNNIEMLSLPARTILSGIIIKPRVAFVGGAIATYTISIGLVGALDIYMPSMSVMTIGDTLFGIADLKTMEDYANVKSVRAQAICSGANLDASTAGILDIWVELAQLPLT